MGNVLEQTLAEILDSPEAHRVRAELAQIFAPRAKPTKSRTVSASRTVIHVILGAIQAANRTVIPRLASLSARHGARRRVIQFSVHRGRVGCRSGSRPVVDYVRCCRDTSRNMTPSRDGAPQ